MTAIADEATVRASQLDHVRADYRRAIARAAAEGHDIEIVAVVDGETQAYAVRADEVSVDGDVLTLTTPEGIFSLRFSGEGASAIIPCLTVMGERWRHRDSARREMRRIGFDGSEPKMVRIWDAAVSEHAPATMVMINSVGIFPPSVQGVEWSETDVLHSSGDVLTARSGERALSFA